MEAFKWLTFRWRDKQKLSEYRVGEWQGRRKAVWAWVKSLNPWPSDLSIKWRYHLPSQCSWGLSRHSTKISQTLAHAHLDPPKVSEYICHPQPPSNLTGIYSTSKNFPFPHFTHWCQVWFWMDHSTVSNCVENSSNSLEQRKHPFNYSFHVHIINDGRYYLTV